MAAYDVRKVIVAGIGGSGTQSVLQVKRKLISIYGELPPTFAFLAFDTTDPETLVDIDYEFKLTGAEFVSLKVKDVKGHVKSNEEIKPWFNTNIGLKDLIEGAHGIRAMGRLGFYAHADDVRKHIDNAIDQVTEWQSLRDPNWNVINPNLNVHIVCSIAGGTGCGIFLDLAYLFKDMLGEHDKIIGHLLLPDVYDGLPFADKIKGNAYTAIRDLDYFMNETPNIFRTFGKKELWFNDFPFNVVCLINNKNQKNVQYGNIKEMTEFLGDGIFVNTGSLFKHSADVLDNAAKASTSESLISRGKRAHYASYGISELVFRIDKFTDLLKKDNALRILNEYNKGLGIDFENEVNSFIEIHSLDEHHSDSVIDAIFYVKKPPLKQTALKLPDLKKGASQGIRLSKTKYINKATAEIIKICETNYMKMLEEKRKTINNFIIDYINREGGLDFCSKFFSSLIGRLRAFKEELVIEKKRYEAEVNIVQAKYEPLRAEIEKSERGLFTAKKIRSACERYQANVYNEYKNFIEFIRREKAIDLYINIIKLLEDWQTNQKNISNKIQRIIEDLTTDIEKIKISMDQKQPFTLILDSLLIKDFKFPDPKIDEFLMDIKNERIGIETWHNLNDGEIIDIFLAYAEKQDFIKNIQNENIEDLIDRLDLEAQKELFIELDDMALPMWDYEMHSSKKPEMLYMFGVPDENNSKLINNSIVKEMKGSVQNPSFVSTRQKHRIVLFRLEVGVAGYMVEGLKEYKDEYKFNPDRKFIYEIDKEWEENIYELFPKDEEEFRKYWSIAHAKMFGLIKKRGAYYSVKSEKQGKARDNYWVQLKNGRVNSMQAFFSNKDLGLEIKDMIEKLIIDKFGNEKTIQGLKEHIEKLSSELKRARSDLAKQLEDELDDIKKYIKDLGGEFDTYSKN